MVSQKGSGNKQQTPGDDSIPKHVKLKYRNTRPEKIIHKKEWRKLSWIEQSKLCYEYRITLIGYKKIRKIDKVLRVFDPRHLNFKNMERVINLINEGTYKVGKGIDSVFEIIDQSIGEIGRSFQVDEDMFGGSSKKNKSKRDPFNDILSGSPKRTKPKKKGSKSNKKSFSDLLGNSGKMEL